MKRCILVSGSSSGIGRAITELLLKSGYRVLGLGRDHDKFCLDDKNYSTFEVDFADLESITFKINNILKENSDLYGVICNAGFGAFKNLESFSVKEIIENVNTNLIAHMILVKAALPTLKKNKKGKIIFIGSEAALRGAKKGTLYNTVKFGLRGFAQAIRQESAPGNIHVTSINPGMVRTPFFDRVNFKPGLNPDNAISPVDVAQLVLTTLEIRTGTVIDEINLSPLKKVIRFE